MNDPCTLQFSPRVLSGVSTEMTMNSPGALTQLAFSLVPTPILSTTVSGSSPPTSVTVIRLELRALPLLCPVLEEAPSDVGVARCTAPDE